MLRGNLLENEIFAGIILVALSGLYFAIYKNHGCIKRIESKLDAHFDIEYIKEEMTDIKDEVRKLNG